MTRSTTLAAGAAVLAAAVVGGGVAYAVVGDDDAALTGDALQQASDAALAHTGEGTVTDSETSDGEGYYEVEVTLDDGREVDVHLDEGFAVLGSERDDEEEDDDDAQVTGPARDEAAAAALEAAGGGTVTDVEAADDGADGYEVEVRLEDGTEVDVDLDADLAVLSVENDDD